MKTDAAGRAFVTREEGKKNLAYPDPASELYRYCVLNGFDPYNLVELTPEMTRLSGRPWTIGVGHTGPEVKQGTYWSDEAVDENLTKDLERWERSLNENVVLHVPLSQNQFNALISFEHNIGEPQFLASTLLRLLVAGDYQGAADQLPRWDVAGGVHNAALHNRRLRERTLFLTPDSKDPV